MKLNGDFRLSKSAKRMLALMHPNKEDAGLWKKFYIEAEVAEKDAKNKKLVIPKGEE